MEEEGRSKEGRQDDISDELDLLKQLQGPLEELPPKSAVDFLDDVS